MLYSFDIETTGLDMTRDQLLGIALTSSENIDDCLYYETEEDMEAVVRWMTETQVELVAWNAMFDVTRLLWKYPWAKLNVVADAAVLALMVDNSDKTVGSSLKMCSQHYLGKMSYTDEIIDYLNDRREELKLPLVNEKNFREYLKHVPHKMVARYCKEDATRTLQFWSWGNRHAKGSVDMWMTLFCAELREQVEAYMHGMRCDVEGMRKSIADYESVIANADGLFFSNEYMQKYFEWVLRDKRQEDYINRLMKSKTGKVKPKTLEVCQEKFKFNTNSPKDKRMLFNSQLLFWDWNSLSWQYPMTTDKGAPCFDSKSIGFYGVGGEILDEIGNKRSMLTRAKKILTEIGSDGRYRCDINLVGAKSGRISSDGSNIVAMPFSEKPVTSNILADDGYEFGSPDFVSLEPSIQAHLSGDQRLQYAVYFGEGKKPFWKDGKLWIDDIYLMTASSVDRFKTDLEIDLDNWVKNPGDEKARNKAIRKVFKFIYLMITYGSGIENVRALIMKLLGVTLTMAEAAKIVQGVWKAYPMLMLFRNSLRDQIKQDGFIVNELGYPLHFSHFGSFSVNQGMLHKIINRVVQSTAAAVMRVYLYNLGLIRPAWMVPAIPNIHDATVHQWPIGKREEAVAIYNKALEETNNDLGWSFPLRLSFSFGSNLYELKQD